MQGAQHDPIESLRRLGRDYHHLQQEHERKQPVGATRRRLGDEMSELSARFERLLAHWVDDDSLKQAWREHFYGHEPPPDEPRLAAPPVFRGQSERGAVAEIREAADGGYDVYLDGTHLDHHDVPWRSEPDYREPVRIGKELYEERFDAPEAAIAALDEFLASPGKSPPWEHAGELLEDGLIDTEFSLTPRGSRALLRRRGVSQQPSERATYCVLAADSARARLFTLDAALDVTEPTLTHLEEVEDLANPAHRARDGDLFTDSRPGLQRAPPLGPSHGVSDRRDARRREQRRAFADMAVEELNRLWQRFPRATVVVAANPVVLGDLRGALARRTRAPGEVVEVPRDVAQLAPPALHDALAVAKALPPRGRRWPPLV